MIKDRTRGKGFTLIEVVLAIAVGLIIIAGVSVGYDYAKRSAIMDNQNTSPTASTTALSEADAVAMIKKENPSLAGYPGGGLPPREIRTEHADNGWYMAFVETGSGVPFLHAQCFFVSESGVSKKTGALNLNPSKPGDSATLSLKDCTVAAAAVPVAAPGEHCGGNVANAPVCAPGYHCAPNPNSHLPFGDVGGMCVSSTSTTQGKGTLQGTMTVGPICPVEQTGNPCKPSPETYAAHPVYVYKTDQKTLIATLVPDAGGHFQATLAAGDYWVNAAYQSVGGARGVPMTIHIVTGKTVQLAIDIDTGIR